MNPSKALVLCVVVVIVGGASLQLDAQEPASIATFEVASIKPRTGERVTGGRRLLEDRFTLKTRVEPREPPLLTAIQEQLGLRLESSRGPVPVLIIERAELPTSD